MRDINFEEANFITGSPEEHVERRMADMADAVNDESVGEGETTDIDEESEKDDTDIVEDEDEDDDDSIEDTDDDDPEGMGD